MTLTWNEIKDRALKFSNEWTEESKVSVEKDSFWNDPLTKPLTLVKAHQALDKAVDLCYRPQAFTNENARIE